MASLSKNSKGIWRLQIVCHGGVRRTIHLEKQVKSMPMPKRVVHRFPRTLLRQCPQQKPYRRTEVSSMEAGILVADGQGVKNITRALFLNFRINLQRVLILTINQFHSRMCLRRHKKVKPTVSIFLRFAFTFLGRRCLSQTGPCL